MTEYEEWRREREQVSRRNWRRINRSTQSQRGNVELRHVSGREIYAWVYGGLIVLSLGLAALTAWVV